MHFHLWLSLLFFGVALLVCHAPIGWVKWVNGGIVKSKDRWARAWDKTDYLYLGLAALALIPVGNEVHRLYSGVLLNQRLGFIAYSPGYGHPTLSTFERLRPEGRNEGVGSRLREAVQALDQGRPHLHEAQELLRVGRSEEAKLKLKAAIQAYDHFLSSPDPPLDPKDGWSLDVKSLRSEIQIARDYSSDLLKLNEEISKGEGEVTLVFFGPFLLGLGLAVRVAKVTAKLVAIREEPTVG